MIYICYPLPTQLAYMYIHTRTYVCSWTCGTAHSFSLFQMIIFSIRSMCRASPRPSIDTYTQHTCMYRYVQVYIGKYVSTYEYVYSVRRASDLQVQFAKQLYVLCQAKRFFLSVLRLLVYNFKGILILTQSLQRISDIYQLYTIYSGTVSIGMPVCLSVWNAKQSVSFLT